LRNACECSRFFCRKVFKGIAFLLATSQPVLGGLHHQYCRISVFGTHQLRQLEWNASTISETVVRQNVARLKSRSPWAGLQNWTPRQPRTALSRRRDSFDGRVVGDEPYVSLHFLGADDYARKS
jgi:hypothetical protein